MDNNDSNKSAKEIRKGPLMPPKDVDISRIYNETQSANYENNWLNTNIGENDEDNMFASFGKSYKKKNMEKKILLNDELNKTQNERELNPYWKNGGSGLPNDQKSSKNEHKQEINQIGDYGLSWWNKALNRCKELAIFEGKSLEEVAAERYGSLESLRKKIKEAESLSNKSSFNQNYATRFRKPGESTRSHFEITRTLSSNQNTEARPLRWRKTRSKEENQEKKREKEQNLSRSSSSSSLSSASSSSNERKKQRKKRRYSKDDTFSSSSSSSNERIKKKKKQCNFKDRRFSSTLENTSFKDDKVTHKKSKTNDTDDEFSSKDINELGAELIKAELLDDNELVDKLKLLLDRKRKDNTKGDTKKKDEKNNDFVLIASKTDRFGNEIPLSKEDIQKFKTESSKKDKRKKKKHNSYSKDGKIQEYFTDDSKYSLKDLVENERKITTGDNNLMFRSIKLKPHTNMDESDDIMMQKCASNQLDGWSKIKALADQKSKNESLCKCELCLENAKKHLLIAVGSKSYLCVPSTESLVEGHCFIIPIQHYISSLMVDEDVWSEIQNFRKCLVNMFKSMNKDCIFVEQFINDKGFDHMFIECLPIDYESSSALPIYFKKALLESESEWAQNRQLINLKGKGVRKSIPKGLPYFYIDFGIDDGFAHIIENKDSFPKYFAKSVIGGILDLDANKWRKPINETFQQQSKKVIEFLKYWKSYDFTKSKKENK